MPGTSTAKNPNGVEILFEESTHKYSSVVDGKKISYTSGTAFVHSFFPKFDEDRISFFVAKKKGVSQKEILDEWHEKRDRSCYFGTKVHETAEDVLLGRTEFRNIPQNASEEIVFEKAKKYAMKFKDSMEILGVEKIVFDPDLRIAGTIDLLMRSKKDGSIVIADWKTNESIKQDPIYDYGLHPIEHVPNLNYYHYAMQLNLYQFLLVYSGIFPKDTVFKRVIIHLNEVDSAVYQLPDYQSEIKDMAIDFLARR